MVTSPFRAIRAEFTAVATAAFNAILGEKLNIYQNVYYLTILLFICQEYQENIHWLVMDFRQRNDTAVAKSIGLLINKYKNVSIPVVKNFSYDLLIEGENGIIFKVKVIYTDHTSPKGVYVANLRSFGGYQKGKELKKHFDRFMCDALFIHTPLDYYLIPTENIDNKRAVNLSKFEEYKFIPS